MQRQRTQDAGNIHNSPCRRFAYSGNSFLVSATGAKKFVSNVSRKVSGDTALTGFGPEPSGEIWSSFKTPALLTKISSRPYFPAK
jgi:hypothetical protein